LLTTNVVLVAWIKDFGATFCMARRLLEQLTVRMANGVAHLLPSTSVVMSSDDKDPRDGFPKGWAGRILVIAPAWPIILAGGAVLMLELWDLRLPERAMRATWYHGWNFNCTVILGVRVAQLLMRRVVPLEVRQRARRQTRFSDRRAWLFLLLLLCTTTFVARSRLPLHWALAHSEPSFNTLAKIALKDPAFADTLLPVEAGLYTVSSIVTLDDSSVILYTHEPDVGWWRWGFAYMPSYKRDVRNLDEEYGDELFRYQRAVRMRGDWFVVYDEYWAVKDGWS
jgi:hypothetical protein